MDAPSDHSLSRKKRRIKGHVGETVSIHVDLVMDILKRLSARDVLRSRSVCKEWNLLLTSPKFISLHYKQQMRHEDASFIYLRSVPARPSFQSNRMYANPESITLTFLSLEKRTTKLVAKVDKEEDFIAMLPSLLFPYCPTESDMDTLQMICPFDGLICFGCGERVIMYNPATRESRVLPFYPEYSKASTLYILGVWFESTEKQHYKVFRMDRGNHSCKIHIYDSTVDIWRVSKTVDGTASYRSGLLLNGVVYFDVMKASGVHVIVTFDAKLETFGYLEMPPFVAKRWHVSLLPFRGNLACMDKYIDMNQRTLNFDLWVMAENGVHQSWTQKQKFRVPSYFPGFDMHADEYSYGFPIAFWENKDGEDELLFKAQGETVSFNLNTRKKTNLKLPYIPLTEIHIIPYNKECLFSVK